jgi:hypothetical protein
MRMISAKERELAFASGEAAKRTALPKKDLQDKFRESVAKGLFAVAQWAEDYDASYKEAVATVMSGLGEDTRQEVTRQMRELVLLRSDVRIKCGTELYYPVVGALLRHRFLHRPSNGNRATAKWARASENSAAYGGRFQFELDETHFAPLSSVAAADMNTSFSLTEGQGPLASSYFWGAQAANNEEAAFQQPPRIIGTWSSP